MYVSVFAGLKKCIDLIDRQVSSILSVMRYILSSMTTVGTFTDKTTAWAVWRGTLKITLTTSSVLLLVQKSHFCFFLVWYSIINSYEWYWWASLLVENSVLISLTVRWVAFYQWWWYILSSMTTVETFTDKTTAWAVWRRTLTITLTTSSLLFLVQKSHFCFFLVWYSIINSYEWYWWASPLVENSVLISLTVRWVAFYQWCGISSHRRR